MQQSGPYSGRSGHRAAIPNGSVLTDFVAEVGFEGRVGRPEDILGRCEAIVLRRAHAERRL
jgi:hypothetical protein